jgi:ArsR family transcriptional regulator, arsenate/arsenite/antimonite-responsive transcriptional repressor
MKERSALAAFSALSHQSRLDVFRVLLEAGPDGLPAGEIAHRLGIAPNALSFHLTQLRDACLVTNKRNGRQIVYAADYAGMQSLIGFLTENCCQRSAKKCSPKCAPKRSSGHRGKKRQRQTLRSTGQ